MFSVAKDLFKLLTPAQRNRFIFIQLLVILMALTEIIGIASIGPFMTLIADISVLDGDGTLAKIYQESGVQSPEKFVLLAGLGSLLALGIGTSVSVFGLWRLSIFATSIGIELGNRLYGYYMNQPWLFHANSSSAHLTQRVASDSMRVTALILQPMATINAKIVLALFIGVGLFIFNPLVALAGTSIFVLAYLIIFKLVKRRIKANGYNITSAQRQRFSLMSEGFGGIRDVQLMGVQKTLIERFVKEGRSLSYSHATNLTLAGAPRFFIEFLAFGLIISLVLFLMSAYENRLGEVLPLLSLYALAGFKLLPAFQQIYSSLASIKSGLASFESIKADLQASVLDTYTISATEDMCFNESISLKDVSFTYPGNESPVIHVLDISLLKNQVIGIVGSTGSGKSTTLDLILGLINPTSGELLIDNKKLTRGQMQSWQRSLGYVPQTIFLADTSIKSNIAFGQHEDDIDIKKIKQAMELACLSGFISKLPKGIDTEVGEKGIKLSGGQRQRIGIARALYRDPDLLIFDEATSALDNVTEQSIMKSIESFSGKKTIIMIAHRFTTVQNCDVIFMMESGNIADSGTYSELYARNEKFRHMAAHSNHDNSD